MILAAGPSLPHWTPLTILGTGVILVLTTVAVMVGARPLGGVIQRREAEYDLIFRRALLLDISPRFVTFGTGLVMLVLAFVGYAVTLSVLGVLLGLTIGVFLPHAMVRYLRRRRLRRLEDQLVGGIQTLASGVRAGLNLAQSMGLVARDGPSPLRQEFRHLMREYEYGVSLDEAMRNAADRIGSSDFRLLFSALQTHRERGGDLGETLDRIAASIREIQRLEKQVQTLTAQGRATARWLGAMPIVILVILYVIDPEGVRNMFIQPIGKMILAIIVVLNVLGFLWIRKTIAIDI
ncbi:MAG TPA: type II secretion system F family protein [Phycisphaerae bacterium]|nr:type II secretion system F family protein [Phycisphaerae bacterium]HUU21823.1 type II secretion system F family protein [Phycisphaerae bacterium]